MHTILVTNLKGGSGKTTISDEIAFSLDRSKIPYNYYDMDGQGGSIHETKEDKNAVVSIIDTAGSLKENLGELIEAADLIVIPTRMTRRDIRTLQRMIDITEKQSEKIIFVLNGWDRFTTARAFQEWFDDIREGRDYVIISQSEQFGQASACDMSVVEYAPRSRVAGQVKEMVNLIRSRVGFDKEK